VTSRRSGGGSRGGRTLRTLLAVGGALLLSAALTVPVTLLLLPVWSWMESATGIEAVGHSGPAEWCYLAVFALLASGAALLLLARWRKGRRSGIATT
jgi:hypothetical protein